MLYFARWKIALIVLIGLAGASLAFAAQGPGEGRGAVVDQYGGAHLLLEVDRDALVTSSLATLLSDVRQALRAEAIGHLGLQSGDRTVVLTLRDSADADRAMAALTALASPAQAGEPTGRDGLEAVAIERSGERITVTLTEAAMAGRLAWAAEQSLAVLSRRIDALGMRDVAVERQDGGRILVRAPWPGDSDELRDVLVRAARMTVHLGCDEGGGSDIAQAPPLGCVLAEPAEEGGDAIAIETRVRLTGEDLVDAQVAVGAPGRTPSVMFRLTAEGSAALARLTQENVGRRLAVLVDDKVMTAPVIQTAILSGVGQIQADFTAESATRLAALLRAGALPAGLVIVEERAPSRAPSGSPSGGDL